MNKSEADDINPEEEKAADVTTTSGTDLRQALQVEIGNKLAAARLALLEELDVPARKLKLRRKHLEALESGHWDAMPDEVYAMGFLRQYSAYLGLDLSEEVERLKNSAYTLTHPLTFPDPPVAPSRRWAWIAAALFLILIVVFNFLYQDLGPRHPSSEVTVSYSEATAPSDVEQDPPKAMDAPAAESDTTKRASTPAATVSAAPAAPVSEQPSSNTTARIAPQASDSRTPQPRSHTYRFDAVDAAVWIQVSRPNQAGDGKGRLIREILLEPGHHIEMRQRVDALWITCGNAPSLRITIDGRVMADAGSLSTGKKVLRDHRISSEE